MRRAFPTFTNDTRALLVSALVLSACGSAEPDATEAHLVQGSAERPAARAPGAALGATLGGLDAESREALARVPFPVLLLPARWSPRVMSVEGQRWVAESAHQDGVHLALHGTDVAHPDLRDEEVANVPTPTTLVRGVPAWITLNEQVRSAAWNEGAVAWSLEVECERPFEDTRCTEDEFVRTLAEALEVVDPQALAGAGGAR
jgi:hypothetical protein